MHRTHLTQTALSDAAAEALAGCYVLLVAASCAAVVAGVFLTRRRPGHGRAKPPHGSLDDAYEAAFLAGGPGRVADAALAALHEDGRLLVTHPGLAGVAPGAAARHPVEAAVLATYATAPSGALHWLRAAVMRAPAVQGLGDGLAARGLMVPPGPLRPWRRRITAHLVLCAAGVPLGLVLPTTSSVGRSNSAFSDLQVVLVVLLGGAVGVLCSRVARDRATARGRVALRLHRVRTRKEERGAAHAVAARGLRGVADTELRKQLAQARRLRVGHPPAVPVAASPAPFGATALWTGAPVAWCAGGTGCGGPSCGTANRDGEGDSRDGSGSGCGSGGSGCGTGGCGAGCGGGCGGGGGGGD
ncbi:TIGR04222 domain-containing membrane protein [Streptomyces sp. AN091965]|uniref:TIGR04222 domain-containing membrane protein n=1 Tax=Streptomyces sp. AN091965 TaxID=2927803 RepID=UPI001F60D2BD|nr:TIGR04222 domain-containing membrane protein [Streptomyces sp. AN091965]MCI3933674.1 TIGR04222 domain-containing membrane protein [Streptomyces sp. AN091965]